MHILLIAYEFPPSPSPQSLRWAYLARHLAEQGHRISVLTIHLGGEDAGLPWLPSTLEVHRTFAGPVRGSLAALRDRRHRRVREMVTAGDTSASTSTPAHSRQGWKQALSDMLQGAAAKILFPDVRGEWFPWARRRLEALLATDAPDVVITSHEPATTLQLGLLAKRRGLPWIADLGDPVLAPYTPARWRRRAWRLERQVAEHADHILVTTRAAEELLQDRHDRKHGISVITQGHAGETPLRRESTSDGYLPGRLELLYTGSFYSFRRPEALLDALREVPLARLNVAAVTLPQSIVDFAHEFPEQVRLLGFLPHTDALRLQRSADLLVNIGNADPSQVPGKIYEYLGACRPILHIGGKDDAIGGFLSRLQRGWSCDNRSDSIASHLRGLAADKQAGRFADSLDLSLDAVSEWHWGSLASRVDAVARSVRTA